MRKIIPVLLLASVLTCGLTACGDPTSVQAPGQAPATTAAPSVKHQIDEAGEALGTKAGKLTDEGVQKLQDYKRYAESDQGKAAAKKLAAKTAKAAKELGGAVGDYLKDLP